MPRWQELSVLVNGVNRYAAHAELDRLFSRHKRHDVSGQPRWRYAFFQFGEKYLGVIRSTDRIMSELFGRDQGLTAVDGPAPDEDLDFLIHFAPSKGRHFTSFRTCDAFAIDMLRSKLAHAIDISSIQIESRTSENIAKPKFVHTLPTAVFRIKGVVLDAQATADIFMYGVGSGKAFGFGLPLSSKHPTAGLLRQSGLLVNPRLAT